MLRSLRWAFVIGGAYYPLLSGHWWFRGGRLSFWCKTRRIKPPFSAALAATWPVGVALLIWAVLDLRSGGPPSWRWWLGGLLSLVGAIAVPLWWRGIVRPEREGLLVGSSGLVQIDSNGYRAVPREVVDRIAIEDRSLVARTRSGQGLLLHRAPPPPVGDPELRARAEALTTWLQQGVLPVVATSGGAVFRSPVVSVAIVVGWLAASAGLAGFVEITMVHPQTTKEAVTAQRFVEAIHRDRDRAYAMLSSERREALRREDFARELPGTLAAATGLTINGVSHRTTMDGTTIACVEGPLQDTMSTISFRIVEEGEFKIDRWSEIGCRGTWWW